jgi:uncharacterized protein YkwD
MGVAAHAADGPSKGFASALLAEHNSERDRAGVPRLVWSGKLAHEAHQWAEVLARENTMRHAPRDISRGAGENLWMGAAGYYGPDKMVGAFVDENRVFVYGTFPKVSTTGRWQDVGHYTQVVWRDTKEVGCAIARGEAYDFLVCRYWPAGNWIGQVPF